MSEVQWGAEGDQGPPVPLMQDPGSETTEQAAGAGLPYGHVGENPRGDGGKEPATLPDRHQRGSGRALANPWQMNSADR